MATYIDQYTRSIFNGIKQMIFHAFVYVSKKERITMTKKMAEAIVL